MTSREELLQLLDKLTGSGLTNSEYDRLMLAIRAGDLDEELLRHIHDTLETADLSGIPALPHLHGSHITRKIFAAEKNISPLIPAVRSKWKKVYWLAAAVVLGIAAVSALLVFNSDNARHNLPADVLVSVQGPQSFEHKVNNTADDMLVELEEGSTVQLKPGSSLRYPQHFSEFKREVFLEGEAFFDVTKNRRRPFFVYNKNIVTHVLGTSFRVKAVPEKKTLEIAVRTGKVKVYENTADKAKTIHPNGVILLPNQKATYHENSRQFVATIVDYPLPIPKSGEYNRDAAPDSDEDLVSEFQEIRMKDLLAQVQARYGIEIVVESENIYKCMFTGDISERSLFSQLDLICKALNTSYEIIGTKILIKGKGCD